MHSKTDVQHTYDTRYVNYRILVTNCILVDKTELYKDNLVYKPRA